MNSFFKIVLVFGLLLIPGLALAVPGIPHQFYGQVSFSNGPAPDGLVVEARIGSVTVATTTTLNGKYGYSPLFFVTDPDNDRAGKTITFLVNGIDTGLSATFENGEHTEKNFSISGNVGTITKSENETIIDQAVIITPTTPTVIKVGDKLDVTISSQANATATIEKIQKLESNFFTGAYAVPAGKNALKAFEIKITGNVSITVTMGYDGTGMDESTIVPYKFDGTTWIVITSYTRDEVADTLTFEIQAETPYAVFGSEIEPEPAAPSGGGGGGGEGTPTTYKTGDINKDGKVDKYDFALMMAAWGKIGTTLSDLNNDNKVDKYDFALLMLNWSTT